MSVDVEFAKAEQLVFNEYCDVKALQDRNSSVQLMRYYLDKLDLDINQLRFVHVTGSKGKGTCCSYVESALRRHGLKTGFFSSPHLQNLCERFRINGKCISKETYLEHFNVVWPMLQEVKQDNNRPDYIAKWPGFFRFLTLIAFRLFLQEKVDVVVLEVGMGGRLDCTNVIETPITTGITLIDLEHTEILGHTLAAIAKEKGGIFKKGVSAVVLDQDKEVIDALKECATETECSIQVVKPLNLPEIVRDDNETYLTDNFTVAFYLTRNVCDYFKIEFREDWMKEVKKTMSMAARCQHVRKGVLNCLIDGAHTPKSMQAACDWFQLQLMNVKERKVLLFYCGRDKNCDALLSFLVRLPIDEIVFTMVKHPKPEYTHVKLPTIEELLKDRQLEEKDVPDLQIKGDENEWLVYLAKIWRIEETYQHLRHRTIRFVKDANQLVDEVGHSEESVTVCCTGSLYLCGDFLNAIDWKEENCCVCFVNKNG